MPVQDKESFRVGAYASHYDNVRIVNLDGYKSKDILARVFISDIDLMYKIAKIEFHYKNEKRKEKTLKYKEIDFSNVPRVVEEPENEC